MQKVCDNMRSYTILCVEGNCAIFCGIMQIGRKKISPPLQSSWLETRKIQHTGSVQDGVLLVVSIIIEIIIASLISLLLLLF